MPPFTVALTECSAKTLGQGTRFPFIAHVRSPEIRILAHVMCDDIAGTAQSAGFKPTVPSIAWPTKIEEAQHSPRILHKKSENVPPTSYLPSRIPSHSQEDEYDCGEVDDEVLLGIPSDTDKTPDNKYGARQSVHDSKSTLHTSSKSQSFLSKKAVSEISRHANGKYACNHRCKDKRICKHMCCRDGLDQPPKQKNKKAVPCSSLGIEMGKASVQPQKPSDQVETTLSQIYADGEMTRTSGSTRRLSTAMKALERMKVQAMGPVVAGGGVAAKAPPSSRRHTALSFLKTVPLDEKDDEIVDTIELDDNATRISEEDDNTSKMVHRGGYGDMESRSLDAAEQRGIEEINLTGDSPPQKFETKVGSIVSLRRSVTMDSLYDVTPRRKRRRNSSHNSRGFISLASDDHSQAGIVEFAHGRMEMSAASISQHVEDRQEGSQMREMANAKADQDRQLEEEAREWFLREYGDVAEII